MDKVECIQEYYCCEKKDTAEKYLANALGLSEFKYNAREAVVVDFLSGILDMGKMEDMKMIELVQICLQLIKSCREGRSRQEVENEFHDALLSQKLFTLSEIKTISTFVAHSFFKHYELLSVLFWAEPIQQNIEACFKIESPGWTPPLADAMTEEEWKIKQEALKGQNGSQDQSSQQSDETSSLPNDQHQM